MDGRRGMATDDERREVAARLRSLAGGYVTIGEVEEALGVCISPPAVDLERDARNLSRLADLIEPAPTSSDRGQTSDPTERGIDSIYEWCRERIEGADGAEDFLYCSIMSAIEEYRNPERVTARTARPVDREALRSVASGLRSLGEREVLSAGAAHEVGDEILEAIGEVDES